MGPLTERQLKALWVEGVINEETFANRPGASTRRCLPAAVVSQSSRCYLSSNRVLCTCYTVLYCASVSITVPMVPMVPMVVVFYQYYIPNRSLFVLLFSWVRVWTSIRVF